MNFFESKFILFLHYILHGVCYLNPNSLDFWRLMSECWDLSVTDRPDPDTWGPALTGTMSGICEEEEDCDSTSLLLSITSWQQNHKHTHTHTCKSPAEWADGTVHDEEKTLAHDWGEQEHTWHIRHHTNTSHDIRHEDASQQLSGVFQTCWSVCFSSRRELSVGSEQRPCGAADLHREMSSSEIASQTCQSMAVSSKAPQFSWYQLQIWNTTLLDTWLWFYSNFRVILFCKYGV